MATDTKSKKLRRATMFKKKKGAIGRRGIMKPRKTSCVKQKLSSVLKPGQIVILLSGGHRGKRVIFLKQFPESGLLLITGPFKMNGVPLRRVNRRYIIRTSTFVDLKGLKLDEIYEKNFGMTKKDKLSERKLKKKSSDEKESLFINQDGEKTKQQLPQNKKDLQDKVDKPILSLLSGDKLMSQYLKTRFTLRNSQKPHQMKF